MTTLAFQTKRRNKQKANLGTMNRVYQYIRQGQGTTWNEIETEINSLIAGDVFSIPSFASRSPFKNESNEQYPLEYRVAKWPRFTGLPKNMCSDDLVLVFHIFSLFERKDPTGNYYHEITPQRLCFVFNWLVISSVKDRTKSEDVEHRWKCLTLCWSHPLFRPFVTQDIITNVFRMSATHPGCFAYPLTPGKKTDMLVIYAKEQGFVVNMESSDSKTRTYEHIEDFIKEFSRLGRK